MPFPMPPQLLLLRGNYEMLPIQPDPIYVLYRYTGQLQFLLE